MRQTLAVAFIDLNHLVSPILSYIHIVDYRYINNKLWMKVLEAALVAATTATVGFAMIYFLNDCRPLGQDPTKFPIQVHPKLENGLNLCDSPS